jgi:hypothetical protein
VVCIEKVLNMLGSQFSQKRAACLFNVFVQGLTHNIISPPAARPPHRAADFTTVLTTLDDQTDCYDSQHDCGRKDCGFLPGDDPNYSNESRSPSPLPRVPSTPRGRHHGYYVP